MARRAAAIVPRRPRKPSSRPSVAGGEDGAAEDTRPQAPAKRSGGAGGFFCCYLLRSTCPRLKGRTYIGFTVNPRRRIRQHNGEISSGAWRTRNGRPWEMVLCIYGFPTKVASLQFEWAWQHPKESLAVRQAAAGFKSLSGAGNKVKLAYAMLNLPSWENLNLTVNFFSSTSTKLAAGCPPLPNQMKTVVCPMEDLQCHAEAIRKEQGTSSNEDPQGPDSLHRDEQSPSEHGQPMDAQTITADNNMDEDNYSSDDFDLMERDRILDLTEPDRSRTSSQCSLSSNSGDSPSSQDDNTIEDPQARQGSPDCHHRDCSSEHSWKQLSTDQVQRIDAHTRTAVYDVEDNYSSDEFVPMERDGILDLTEPEGSRTWPCCSLSSDGDGEGVVEDEVGHVSSVWKVSADGGDDGVVDNELWPSSPVWKVCAGSDGGVFEDELEQAVSPVWKACAGLDVEAVDHELVQASPALKIGTYSDSEDSGVTDDELGQASQTTMMVDACSKEGGRELGQASQTLMVDAGSEGGRDLVVDLVTPTPVGRLQRRAGTGPICHRIIDLTTSPVVIKL